MATINLRIHLVTIDSRAERGMVSVACNGQLLGTA